MKNWRKIVIFTLLLAMPISLWASVAMSSHCLMPGSSSHSAHELMSEHDTMHSDGQVTSQLASEQTNCECNDNSNCSASGCGVIALLNQIKFDLIYSVHSEYQFTQSLANPVDPDLLFRPPISIS